uniref:SHR-BD domain-containing protein n=1 Tax=Heterorhabditis bacteriophora TaxID=37862 RepID=A0A1I7X2E5_HETBA
MRKPIDIDQLDCEQQAQLFRPEKLAPQLIVGTSPRPVQPNSLKTRLSHSIPWKSASQHVIDTLRPECVVENRGKLNFSVTYEKECTTLHVTLLEAVDLPVKDITALTIFSIPTSSSVTSILLSIKKKSQSQVPSDVVFSRWAL